MVFLMIFKLFVITSVLSLSRGKHPLHCKEKLRSVGIIPRYAKSVDTTNISIVYQGKDRVNCGNQLSLIDVVQKPKITFGATKKCSYVTIMFFDPSVLLVNPFLHWLVVNVDTRHLRDGSLGLGNELYAYPQPLFPGDTYVFFVYCQSRRINPKVEYLDQFFKRAKFEPEEFARKYGLTKVIAANFFQLQKLLRQLISLLG